MIPKPGIAHLLASQWFQRAKSERDAHHRFLQLCEEVAAHPTLNVLHQQLERAAEDEFRHISLCTKQVVRFGGMDLAEYAGFQSFFSDDLLSELVVLFCVMETINAALLVASKEHIVDPDLRTTCHEILKDEVQHARIGWAALSLATAEEREQVWKHLHTIFRCAGIHVLLRENPSNKPVTSVAVMMLHERGLLQLDDPIEKYIPEFQDVGVYHKKRVLRTKRSITIRDLMRHTGGLSYGFFSNTAVDKMYMKNHPLYSRNNREMTKKLSAYPLLSQPGKQWHYSVATDLLGDLVERVSGMSLGEFFAQNITKPLSMNDTSFSVSSDRVDRFSSVYGPKQKPKENYKKSHYLQSNRIQSGGGGLVSTAQDYMRFCEMLIHGGELDGVRLLTQKSVAEMTNNQLPEGVFTYGVFGFGLGFQVQLYDWGNKGHIGEYGWDGAASTHFWISPRDELIVIALSQRQPYSSQLKKKIKPIIYRHIKNR